MHSTSIESKTTVLKSRIYRVYWQQMAGSYSPWIGNTAMQKQTLLHKLSIHAPFKRAPCSLPKYLSFFLPIHVFILLINAYIHSSQQNTTLPNTHAYISSYKRFITWCNGVPGEQRELVIKYRSVNVTVFNTMAAVTLFLFLFGLNCHPRSACYGRLLITPPRPHWLCATECFTFKNLVQRPLSLWHTRGLGSETEKKLIELMLDGH